MAVPTHHLPSYRELARSGREIRLVTLLAKPSATGFVPWLTHSIQCKMTYVSLDQRPIYYALSHTWVPRKRNTHKIFVDGTEVPVTENLYEFLKSVGSRQWPTKTFTFWLDTICINQADTTERNHQVSMMRDIYRCAQATLSWLRSWEPEIQHLFAGVRAAHEMAKSQYYTDYDYFESHSQVFWNGFRKLLECPYWTRVWILQEVALANEVYLFCGNDFVTWSEMDRLVGVIQRWEKDRGYRLRGFDTWLALDELRKIGPTTKIWLLLEMFNSANCEDPRDYVYGLLPMAEQAARDEIIVDYKLDPWSVFDSLSRYSHKVQPIFTPGHDLFTTLERLAIKMNLRRGFSLLNSSHYGFRPYRYRKRRFWQWTRRRTSGYRNDSGTSTPQSTSGTHSPFSKVASPTVASVTGTPNSRDRSPSSRRKPEPPSSLGSSRDGSARVTTLAAPPPPPPATPQYDPMFSQLRKPLFIELWSSMNILPATTISSTTRISFGRSKDISLKTSVMSSLAKFKIFDSTEGKSLQQVMLFYEQLAYTYGRRASLPSGVGMGPSSS